KAKPLVVVGESTTSDDLSEVHVTAKKLGDGSTTDDLFAQMCGKLSEQELNDSQKADREKFQNGILILQPEGVEITEENFGPLALNCEILNVLQTRIEEKTCLDNEDK